MNHIVKNQKHFFDSNAQKPVVSYDDTRLIREYINRQQIDGLAWISKAKKLLDYGSGTGGTISLLKANYPSRKRLIHSVDISTKALRIAKKKHPEITTETVRYNKIKKPSAYFDGAMMVHVLHHSRKHEEIIAELHRVLKPNGKLMINDLTSNNPLIKLLRISYPFIPSAIKNRFLDDLATADGIPDKYPVSVNKLVNQLTDVNFKVEKIEYGHLFFFVFCWLDRLYPFSRLRIIKNIYIKLISIEKLILSQTPLRRLAEVVSICATKCERSI